MWWFGVDKVIDLGFKFHITPPVSLALAVLLAVVSIFLYAGPLLRSAFLPPVVLISMIKGSILFGWATPSEAGAVGAFGAIVLAMVAGRLNFPCCRAFATRRRAPWR